MHSYISEDDQKMYNKWVQGIATRDLKGNNIIISDLKQQGNTQGYTNSDVGSPDIKLSKKKPYPLDTIYDDFAGLTISYSNILNKLKMSLDNPILSKRDKQKYRIIIDQFRKIEGVIKNTTNLLEKS